MCDPAQQERPCSADALVDRSLIDAMAAQSREECLRQDDRMLRTILFLEQGLRDSGRDGRARSAHHTTRTG